MAEYQAQIIFNNITGKRSSTVDYSLVPWAIFTDPEIAKVGLGETEARQKGLDYRCVRIQLADIDRAKTEGQPEGFGKLLLNEKQEILGAALVCQDAGSIIQEIILAMACGLKLSAIRRTIRIYPTLSRAVLRLAQEAESPRMGLAQKARLLWKRKIA